MIIVFAGPSIAGLSLPDTGDFDVRAPVQQGDIYLATLEKPQAIGVIDGYFEGVPAVWHKEILWALTQGIPVLGAASMGALRAAELEPFGMVGIGAVFEAYRDAILEDDDDVALLHGPREVGYPSLSLAMVNVRATLEAARRVGIVTPGQARHLAHTAKAEFYKTRTWDSILRAIPDNVLAASETQSLKRWIDGNFVDQKRRDAQALLDALTHGVFAPPKPGWHFEETDLWHNATQIWRSRTRFEPETQEDGYRLFGSAGFQDE